MGESGGSFIEMRNKAMLETSRQAGILICVSTSRVFCRSCTRVNAPLAALGGGRGNGTVALHGLTGELTRDAFPAIIIFFSQPGYVRECFRCSGGIFETRNQLQNIAIQRPAANMY
jgi:hypothetical protein